MKKLILALFMVCVTASIGHTESAWVLWEKIEHTEKPSSKSLRETSQSTSWKILDAYPLYKDCQNFREIRWKDRKNGANAVKKEDKNITVIADPFRVIMYWGQLIEVSEDYLHIHTEYFCLPETVNPKLFEKIE